MSKCARPWKPVRQHVQTDLPAGEDEYVRVRGVCRWNRIGKSVV